MRSVLIDLLRIAAIILVILSHLFQFQHNPWGNMIDFFGQQATIGGIGVSIFIVLSGLSLQLNKKNLPYFDFLKKRILRIYPVYLYAVLFALSVHFFLSRPFSLLDLACTITGFCAFIGLFGGAILPVGWFIGLIACLYAIFPFLSKTMEKKPFLMLIAMFALAFSGKLLVSNYFFLGARSLDWFPISRIFEFSLGIFLAIKAPKIWGCLDHRPFSKAINFFGGHSFELFLFHYPILELAFS